MQSKILLFAALVFVITIVSADAWEVYDFPDGRTVAPVDSSVVALRAESVLIAPSETLLEETGLPLMSVHAVFHLRNLSDDSLCIKVGFPFETAFGSTYHTLPDSDYYGHFSYPPDLIGTDVSDLLPEYLNFRARADGVPLEIEFFAQKKDSASGLMYRPVDAVWEMRFAPGQSVRLQNDFYTSWDIDSGENPRYAIRYLMGSGSTWKGTVDSATVVLFVPRALPNEAFNRDMVCCWDYTAPAELSEWRLVWNFRDFEPEGWLEMAIYQCEPERALSYVDSRSAFLDVASDISWSPDSMVPSALQAVRTATHCRIPTPFVIGYLYEMLREHSPPAEELGVPPELALELVVSAQRRLEDDMQVVRRNGFEEFLPLFALKRRWDASDGRRFDFSPATRRRYLFLLSALPGCVQGGAPNNVELSAFYRLIGWYWPGWKIWGSPETNVETPPGGTV